MEEIKAKLKRFRLAYCLYKFLLKIKRFIVVIYIKTFFDNKKQTSLMSFDKAYRLLNSKREEKHFSFESKEITKKKGVDLSVIVPVYNGEKWLTSCLDSIKKQRTNYHYEVICVNDGSTDNTAEILKQYEPLPNFLIVHQENRGHSGARNTALELPLGTYIAFVDSDDYISENFVESLLFEAKKSGAAIVQGQFCKVDADERPLERYGGRPGVYNSFKDYVAGAPIGRIYKRELWENVRFPEGLMFEDVIIFNVIFRKVSSVTVLREPVYYYRIHGGNTLDKLQGDSRLIDSVWGIKLALEMAEANHIEPTADHYLFLLRQCSRHIYYRICKMPMEVQEAAFVIACAIVCSYREKLEDDIELDSTILCALDKSFCNCDFSLWLLCCKVLER